MIYAMSDIHGQYDCYLQMLEKIRFCDEDTLYILGDAVDRGPKPVTLLQDMARRENVYPILGNHDAHARLLLRQLLSEVTEERCDALLAGESMPGLMNWLSDGGFTTVREFSRLSAEARQDVLDYLDDFPLYEIVDAGEKTFVLVHAGLENFDEDRRLRDYSADELLYCRHPVREYFSDPGVHVVAGHTPTLSLSGKPRILHAGNTHLIDCGCVFDGALACLCLDTMEEFYI